MTKAESLRALKALAASPAAAWIGNKVVDGAWLQKCVRCGVEERLVLPPNVRSPVVVPPSFDEKLFGWKRSFQIAHEGCPDVLS